MNELEMMLTVEEVAERLGISKRRVQAMINQPCPRCNGEGVEGEGFGQRKCSRCRGMGRKLPAMRFGNKINSPWMIYEFGLELEGVADRKPGNPGTGKTNR